MLAFILRGFEFDGFGVRLVARWWDVEVRVGPYGIGVMWGQAGEALFLHGPQGERCWSWRELAGG